MQASTSSVNAFQTLNPEKRQLLAHLLFILTAHHRQQKLAATNQQIEKASSSQQ